MRFTKIDEYHLRSGEWTIAKYSVTDVTKYLLWRDKVLVDVFDDADSAKRGAEKGITCARA